MRGLAAAALFVALGGAILWFDWAEHILMRGVAWAALLFGLIGIIGISLRLSGLWKPELRQPSPRSIARQNAQMAKWRAMAQAPIHFSGELPELAPARKGVVRRVVRLMAEEGVFAPDVPDPAMLFAGIAEWDGPVTQTAILSALGEADYWHPGFDPARYSANLVLHESDVEQLENGLRAQIDDLSRLAKGALDVRDVSINLAWGDEPQCAIRMTVNGVPIALDYAPSTKYLSTHIHVALARALKSGGGGQRLAWVWNDQGAWVSCLADGAVERLNAGPGVDKAGHGGWSWIDAAEPVAAGAMPL